MTRFNRLPSTIAAIAAMCGSLVAPFCGSRDAHAAEPEPLVSPEAPSPEVPDEELTNTERMRRVVIIDDPCIDPCVDMGAHRRELIREAQMNSVLRSLGLVSFDPCIVDLPVSPFPRRLLALIRKPGSGRQHPRRSRGLSSGARRRQTRARQRR